MSTLPLSHRRRHKESNETKLCLPACMLTSVNDFRKYMQQTTTTNTIFQMHLCENTEVLAKGPLIIFKMVRGTGAAEILINHPNFG